MGAKRTAKKVKNVNANFGVRKSVNPAEIKKALA